MNLAERLVWARKRRFPDSATEAAEAMGIPPPTYLAHENGSRGFGRVKAQRYSEFFRINLEWLLTGKGDPEAKGPNTLDASGGMSVKGYVQAGTWQESPMESGEIIPVGHDGRYASRTQFALKVVGPSMNKVVEDGSYVVCVAWDGSPRENDLVIVERRQHGLYEATIKRVRIKGTTVELWPESTDPDPRNQAPLILQSKDGVEVVIVARVIGKYSPL